MKAQNDFPTQSELALMGKGEVCYIRKISSDDLSERFPDLPLIASGIELWALFGAAGEPIILSDVRSAALASAHEHELQTLPLH